MKIKAINRVFEPKSSKEALNIYQKLTKQNVSNVPYIKTHNYKEEYDNDELSISETDSEFEE